MGAIVAEYGLLKAANSQPGSQSKLWWEMNDAIYAPNSLTHAKVFKWEDALACYLVDHRDEKVKRLQLSIADRGEPVTVAELLEWQALASEIPNL